MRLILVNFLMTVTLLFCGVVLIADTYSKPGPK